MRGSWPEALQQTAERVKGCAGQTGGVIAAGQPREAVVSQSRKA